MEKKRLLVLSLALHIVTLLSLIPYAFLLHKAGPAEPEGALMVLLDSFRVLFCLEFLNIVFTGIALVLKGVQFVLKLFQKKGLGAIVRGRRRGYYTKKEAKEIFKNSERLRPSVAPDYRAIFLDPEDKDRDAAGLFAEFAARVEKALGIKCKGNLPGIGDCIKLYAYNDVDFELVHDEGDGVYLIEIDNNRAEFNKIVDLLQAGFQSADDLPRLSLRRLDEISDDAGI